MATRTTIIACLIAAAIGTATGSTRSTAADRSTTAAETGQTRELVNRPDSWDSETADGRRCEFVRQ